MFKGLQGKNRIPKHDEEEQDANQIRDIGLNNNYLDRHELTNPKI